MEKTELEYQLALWLVPGLPPSIHKIILENYPNLLEFFELTSVELQNVGFIPKVIQAIHTPNWHGVEKILTWSSKPNNHLILFQSPNYPQQLREIKSAPCILMAQGQIDLLNYNQIAIVGSRNPTNSGLTIAKNYAQFLAHKGLVITSGLALGIDAAAHQGSLDQTIAILGTGIDVNYPKNNAILADTIRERGLLVSEFILGTPPQAQHFPRRNRIISGLSLGVFVVEATIKSGSLITARFALEQGREVFTIPGSIYNPMAKGCHWLLKEGAILIESAEDIWANISTRISTLCNNKVKIESPLDISFDNPHLITSRKKLSKLQQQLLNVIGFDRISMDLLIQRTNLNPEQLSIQLLEMEIMGLIETVPGGFQRKQK